MLTPTARCDRLRRVASVSINSPPRQQPSGTAAECRKCGSSTMNESAIAVYNLSCVIVSSGFWGCWLRYTAEADAFSGAFRLPRTAAKRLKRLVAAGLARSAFTRPGSHGQTLHHPPIELMTDATSGRRFQFRYGKVAARCRPPR